MNPKIREALGLLASVIKSGEPWTEHCEKALQEALAALDDGWILFHDKKPPKETAYELKATVTYNKEAEWWTTTPTHWRELPSPPKEQSDD